MTSSHIDVSGATAADIPELYLLRKKHGTAEPNYFERCLEQQEAGKRSVLVLREDGQIRGYVHIIWQPVYAPFRKFGIPEIEDLLIDPDHRGRGFGKTLLGFCEEQARRAGKKEIGLGVGLYGAYGPAQRFYVSHGYIPDGNGIVYESTPVAPGEIRPVDDFLCLKLTRKLVGD